MSEKIGGSRVHILTCALALPPRPHPHPITRHCNFCPIAFPHDRPISPARASSRLVCAPSNTPKQPTSVPSRSSKVQTTVSSWEERFPCMEAHPAWTAPSDLGRDSRNVAQRKGFPPRRAGLPFAAWCSRPPRNVRGTQQLSPLCRSGLQPILAFQLFLNFDLGRLCLEKGLEHRGPSYSRACQVWAAT